MKVFVDADGDGRPERQWSFADGFEDGMNLAFSPGGELYLVTAKSVWALHDRDGDGVSDGVPGYAARVLSVTNTLAVA